MKTNIQIQANRADWLLIRRVYGRNGGAFAKAMLAIHVSSVAVRLRAEGIVENSRANRKRLMELCNV